VRRWWTVIGVAAAATVVAEVVTHDAGHDVFPWHAVPGFDLAYGAAGCVAIVVLSKALGKAWLQRDEDYWETRE
jgi:hypothetical protein